jgi:hypothetical protein
VMHRCRAKCHAYCHASGNNNPRRRSRGELTQ